MFYKSVFSAVVIVMFLAKVERIIKGQEETFSKKNNHKVNITYRLPRRASLSWTASLAL